jgi:hypothetical protein
MKTKLTLYAGNRGTKKMVDKYGDRLICVRYRYDEKSRKHYKTVDLIEEIVDWHPQDPVPTNNTLVEIKIDWEEFDLRKKVKERGGIWNSGRKVWRISLGGCSTAWSRKTALWESP